LTTDIQFFAVEYINRIGTC